MTASRKLTSALLTLIALVVISASALAADPGLLYPPTSAVSDQKAGSVLFYNLYTSGATSSNTQNTRINITNASSTSAAFVHLFFVAEECSAADSFLCLTANQTASFLTSDIDPGVTGYIVAIASDGRLGCPVAFNHLLGDEYVKLSTGHAANLGAEAFAALYNGIVPGCNEDSSTATLNFSGVVGSGYNAAPRVLALSNFGSPEDGNNTLLIINRFGGNLATGGNTIGALFGLVYDDSENAGSFQIQNSNCQLRSSLSNSFPRSTPRLTTLIQKGHSGWLKIYNIANDFAYLGAAINMNTSGGDASTGAFNGGHNLHKLRLSAATSLTIPIFPPSC